MWDLSLIGVEQTPEEQEDEQPPELVFMHGGEAAFEPLCQKISDHVNRPYCTSDRLLLGAR